MENNSLRAVDAARPKVSTEAELKLRNRLQVRPSRAGNHFGERRIVDTHELPSLPQTAIADRLFHVPGETPRDLVDRVYRWHVWPTDDPLARVRPMWPWHTTSVDDRGSGDA